jgi:hypothetical protein
VPKWQSLVALTVVILLFAFIVYCRLRYRSFDERNLNT